MKHTPRRQLTPEGRSWTIPLAWTGAIAIAGLLVASPLSADTAAASAEAQEPASVAASQGGRAAAASQKRYRATRRIVVDRQSGQPRLPTETEVEELVTTLNTLTRRTTDDLPEATLSSGAVALDLDGGFAGVMLGRVNEDGTIETLCVFTFEEGAEFLGLVEIQ